MAEKIMKMYEHFGTLADAERDTPEKESVYLEIISAAKGCTEEKILASQFITRLFKHFPNLEIRALDALIDLSEDKDICVRKQVIRDLPALCHESKVHVIIVADIILTRLLYAYDDQELQIMYNSLWSLIQIDAKTTLIRILNEMQLNTNVVRQRTMDFVLNRVMSSGGTIIKKDVEHLIFAESKKVIENITCEEFQVLMRILMSTRLIKTTDGQKLLVELLESTAELEQVFNPNDVDQVNRLITCLDFAIPLFSAHVKSTKFVVYVCELLNRYTTIKENDKQFLILKSLAESVRYCETLVDPEVALGQVYNALFDLVTVTDNNKFRNMDLYRLEALLYTLHTLGKQCPNFLINGSEKRKELKKKLLYVNTCTKHFFNTVKQELEGKISENMKIDPVVEKKLKELILACNVNTLIEELFHIGPGLKTISLSWLGGVTESKLIAQIFQKDEKHEPARTVDRESKRNQFSNSRRPPHQRRNHKLRGDSSHNANNNNTNRHGAGWNAKIRSLNAVNSNRRSWRPY